MLHDLMYASRRLLKAPGYTLVVVLILGFGLAVNTQIFAIVNGIFLQPMPVRDSQRLTAIFERSELMSLPHGISFLDFQDIRRESRALTGHVAFFPGAAHFGIPGQSPERGWVEAVTPDAFAKLGVSTVLGRPLQPGDGEMPPATPVAVLTNRYWKTRFGGAPGVIGRTILINGKPFTVVGVAAPGVESFTAMLAVNAFVPSGTYVQLKQDGENFFKYRGTPAWRVVAYLAPGATMDEANAELAVIGQRLAKDYPEDHRNVRFQAVYEKHARPDPALVDVAPAIATIFLGIVGLVLVIACANVANLMGARALDRQKELVVRAALGASRARLIRQLLAESTVLALLAGVVGLILASWGNDLLSTAFATQEIPLRQEAGIGWITWSFTAAMALVAGVASGLFPALRASRADVNEGLKQGGRAGAGVERHRFRNMMVIGQVATSCVVLVAAGLFLRGLEAAHQLNLGFHADRLFVMGFDLNLQGYNAERGLRFEKQLLERVRALPGVELASVSQHVPFTYSIVVRQIWPDNSPAHLVDGRASVTLAGVDAEFLKTMGIRVLRGRDLAPTDDERAPHVAVINETMANTFWPGMNPIGQHFHRDWIGGPPIEVVGVVGTGKYVMLTEDPKPYYYCPLAQAYDSPLTLVVRTTGAPDGFIRPVREIIRALDPDLPVYSAMSMTEHMRTSAMAFMPLRAGAILAAIQGGIGLVLAILGLYAVISYSVTSRTREIGVRMALGANRTDIVKLVSRDGLWLALKGLGIGLVISAVVSVALSRVLFGVSAMDPVAYPAIVGLLLASAALACGLPARRATQVDPIVALRAE